MKHGLHDDIAAAEAVYHVLAARNPHATLNPSGGPTNAEARKVLTAVQRTGNRYGAAHIIDTLRGAATEKIASAGHDRLEVFGAGAALGKEEWRSLIRQLVAAGFLALDVRDYGGLAVAARGEALLGKALTPEHVARPFGMAHLVENTQQRRTSAVGRIEQRRRALPGHRDIASFQQALQPARRQPVLDRDALADRLLAMIGAYQQQDLLALAAQPLDGTEHFGDAAPGGGERVVVDR